MREHVEKWRGAPLELGLAHGAHERRVDARQKTVRWLAKLDAGEEGELCVVHAIGTTSLVAEVFAPRAIGEQVHIELSERQQLYGTVVWFSETSVEVRFPEPIDVDALIDELGAVPAAGDGEAQNICVACQGWLEVDGESYMVEVSDLSQGGACVAAEAAPPLGHTVMLVIQGLSPIPGEVRWRDDGKIGLAFPDMIPFDLLTGWISARESKVGTDRQPRSWPRYSILLKTMAQLGDVAKPVETLVHNISRGGVQITCRRGLRRGEQVVIRLGPAGSVTGHVVWVAGASAGIAFTRTIDSEHVLRPLGERPPAALLQHHATGRRPGLKIQ